MFPAFPDNASILRSRKEPQNLKWLLDLTMVIAGCTHQLSWHHRQMFLVSPLPFWRKLVFHFKKNKYLDLVSLLLGVHLDADLSNTVVPDTDL